MTSDLGRVVFVFVVALDHTLIQFNVQFSTCGATTVEEREAALRGNGTLTDYDVRSFDDDDQNEDCPEPRCVARTSRRGTTSPDT